MSWNKNSFQKTKQGIYKREKFRLVMLNDYEDPYGYDDCEFHFYGWDDCGCCDPGQGYTMDDVRQAFLLRFLNKLDVSSADEELAWY
jgi:hypothetical protein